MPTDAALALENRMAATKANATDVPTSILLIPVALCLLSILLAVESPAFAAVHFANGHGVAHRGPL